jgi:hypothetical protein
MIALQTQQDLLLQDDANARAVEKRADVEATDVWLDAMRSGIGLAPGASLKPIAIGLSVVALGGLQITGTLHLNAEFAIQIASAPVWVPVALALSATAIVVGRRRAG